MKYGFVVADDMEFDAVEKYSAEHGGCEYTFAGDKTLEFKIGDDTVVAVLCGVGKVNAAGATAALIYGKGVEAIINFGLSGAVSGLRKGDIAVGEKTVEHDFDLTPLGYKVGEKPSQTYIYNADKRLFDAVLSSADGAKVCTLATGDMFVSSADGKKFIIENFGAGCCDMESAAIASVCFKSNIPFIAFRSISDDADDTAPESYRTENAKKQKNLLLIAVDAIKRLAGE